MTALTPARRLALYGIASAVAVLLVAYGLISQDQAPLWLSLAAAILGVGAPAVAAAHVPRGRHAKDD